jgi:hypothetical protein
LLALVDAVRVEAAWAGADMVEAGAEAADSHGDSTWTDGLVGGSTLVGAPHWVKAGLAPGLGVDVGGAGDSAAAIGATKAEGAAFQAGTCGGVEATGAAFQVGT